MIDYEILNNNVGLKIRAGVIEDTARKQIDLIVGHPAIKDFVSIVSDVHLGKWSVIWIACRFKEAVISNIVGVDIGCLYDENRI